MKYYDFIPKKSDSSPAYGFFSLWTPFCVDFKEIWRNEHQRILKTRVKEAQRYVNSKRTGLRNLVITKTPKDGGGLVIL